MKFILGLILFLNFFFMQVASAQQQKKENPKGRILNDEAIVYTQPNFDSAVLAYLKAGTIVPMSTRIFEGAFYKILYAKGKTGYIADSDIRSLSKKAASEASKKKSSPKQAESEETAEKPRKKKPMSMTQFAGLNITQMDYKEETMGRTFKEPRMFYGVKLFGPDIVFSGYTVTEVNFIFSPGAPSYYEKHTGRSASGLIFIGDFLLQTVFPQGSNGLISFGFGPMFRYSKFNLQLDNAGTITPYAAEDMALGAVFNLGAAVRLGNVALRAEARYNWEKTKYFGYGLALQMAF